MRIRLLINKLVVILLCCCMAVELTACSSQNRGRQYTVYYTNSSKDKLIEQNYNIDIDTSIEDTARQLLDKMNVKPADKNEYIIKPDNVTLLDVMLDGKAIALNYSSSYKQMSTQVELLFRAAVVKMLTQIDDVLYVHFYVDGKEALYEDGTVIGALKRQILRNQTVHLEKWTGVMYSCIMQIIQVQGLLKSRKCLLIIRICQ